MAAEQSHSWPRWRILKSVSRFQDSIKSLYQRFSTPDLPHALPAVLAAGLQVRKSDSSVQLVPSASGAPTATVVQPDIQACSAVIHKIDQASQHPVCVCACVCV